MEPVTIEESLNKGEEILFSATGIIKVMAFTAYQQFEKVPRTRARRMLNMIESLARQKGMKGEKKFADFIGNGFVKGKELDAFIEEILVYLPETQVFGMLQYLKE